MVTSASRSTLAQQSEAADVEKLNTVSVLGQFGVALVGVPATATAPPWKQVVGSNHAPWLETVQGTAVFLTPAVNPFC